MTRHRSLEEHTAAEVMSTDLLTITPGDSVLIAWELMCQAHVHHLPVVDGSGRCLGVVDAATLASAWEPGGPTRARRPVTAVLPPRPPASLRGDATIPQVAAAMLAAGYDHVTVTGDRDVLVGLITAHDLIAALAGAPRGNPRHTTSIPSMFRMEPVLPGRARREGPVTHTVISPDQSPSPGMVRGPAHPGPSSPAEGIRRRSRL